MMETPTRWIEIENALANLTDYLAVKMRKPLGFEVLNEGFEATCRLAIQLESLERERVDRLCADVSRSGVFPDDTDGADLYWMFHRCLAAKDLLALTFPVLSPHSPFPDIPQDWKVEKVLEWCLVDLWTRRADNWLKLSCMTLCTGMSLQSLDGADSDLGE